MGEGDGARLLPSEQTALPHFLPSIEYWAVAVVQHLFGSGNFRPLYSQFQHSCCDDGRWSGPGPAPLVIINSVGDDTLLPRTDAQERRDTAAPQLSSRAYVAGVH